jgi:Fic family protein
VASDRAGTYQRQPGGFRAFVPKPLPPVDLRLDETLLQLLSEADVALGRLDGAVSLIPDPDLFVMQYVRREAVLSSQIEGTHASLMDVLEYEAEAERAEARMDVAEIVNYIKAMNHGLARLPELPLSRRLLSEVHAVLMKDVRGGEPHKTPGEFRKSQNWIGGGSPATARYVPPPPEVVDDSFSNLEAFLHDPEPMPALFKAGLAHAQFEIIHPFLDGNGRVGRLLITFWLVERGILRKPLLYTSLYLKQHRESYVERLRAITDDGDWEGWLSFFLDGVAQVAKEATETATKIVELRERDRTRLASALGRRAGNALAVLDLLFRQPIISSQAIEKLLNVSQPTASALVRDLVDAHLLIEMTGKQRNRRFAYAEYLMLFPGADSRE